jgi:uncharacterized protein (DUF1778 family)
VEKLQSLSSRLKAYQHKLIEEAAAAANLPPDSVIMKIAALENAIVAVETLIAERAEQRE